MAPRIPRGSFSPNTLHLQQRSPALTLSSTNYSHAHIPQSTPLAPRTSRREMTLLRRGMWAWMNTVGQELREPRKNSTNYLTQYDRSGAFLEDKDGRDQNPVSTDANNEASAEGNSRQRHSNRPMREINPFPLNEDFKSEAVLSEALRDEIFHQVVEQARPVRQVSANLGIDMRRVGAVVRLKTIENDWIKQGKRRATPYQKAMLSMLPQTPFQRGHAITPHESINDLPVHSATGHQLFHPTSESRHFTRVDAGKVFHPHLLPADQRIPHPWLIELEKDRMAGIPDKERMKRHGDRLWDEQRERKAREEERKATEDKRTTVVQGQRWDFVFRDVNAEKVGRDGRGADSVGWRYGVPLEDRKRGQVKIPTSVA